MTRTATKRRRAEIAAAAAAIIAAAGPETSNRILWQWLFIKLTLSALIGAPFIYEMLSWAGTNIFRQEVLSFPYFKVMSFTALTLTGIFLYLLRERLRYAYGALEISFALAVIAQSANLMSTRGIEAWTVAAGAVYVLVRGLDNLVSGFKSPPALTKA